VPDKTATHGHEDPEAVERSSAAELAAGDPGPIEVEAVMKNFVPPVHDPMAHRDLHLGEAQDDDADSAG
jgi:hypothetical protein